MEKIIITKASQGQRIDKFLKRYYPLLPKSYLYKLFRKKEIKINHRPVKPDYLLQIGDELNLYIAQDKQELLRPVNKHHEKTVPLQIVYEDPLIMIVNKPIGQIVQDGDPLSLTAQVISYLISKDEYTEASMRLYTPAAIHRLDQNTSGLVIFGKTLQSLRALNQMMQNGDIERCYQCVVNDQIPPTGHLRDQVCYNENINKGYLCPDGKNMETMYRVIKTKPPYALVDVKLLTGRKHQIRIHLSSIGFPIIGDHKYGYQGTIKFPLLHASQITFKKAVDPLIYLNHQSWQSLPPFLNLFD